MKRASGVLMPIFSLPGKYGIGTFGKEAYNFADYIKEAGVKYWQILPIHPLTLGNSPYQSTSTYAGNMYLIDLDMLYELGVLRKLDYKSLDFGSDTNKIDYDKLAINKKNVLILAANNFIKSKLNKSEEITREYEDFKSEFSFFLNDYSVYALLKERYGGRNFSEWDKIHKLHYEEVIKEFEEQNKKELEVYKVIQFFFFSQWFKLKKYVNEIGIKIIGDMPIYSSLDSVEVFSDYKNFDLDENRKPKEVAGCPPDAFSEDGQLWKNPLYDYDYMKSDGYGYFVRRIKHLHKLYDVIRIDHFRGFASYYAIPADSDTAKNGVWKLGPGIEIFNEIKKSVNNLDIIAEDLGMIDETVHNLLNETGFPGMKVVEFAFGGDPENHPYLPKNYNENAVAYLGTHDNDTFLGWLSRINDYEYDNARKYLHLDREGFEHLDAIKELFKSKANLTIVMMQDLLGLGNEARINTPSTVSVDNWSYRFSDKYLDKNAQSFLKELIKETER